MGCARIKVFYTHARNVLERGCSLYNPFLQEKETDWQKVRRERFNTRLGLPTQLFVFRARIKGFYTRGRNALKGIQFY